MSAFAHFWLEWVLTFAGVVSVLALLAIAAAFRERWLYKRGK